MAIVLGKRKRRQDLDPEKSGSQSPTQAAEEADFLALLQKNFEAQFEPLEREEVRHERVTEHSDGEDSDWSGFQSEGEELEIDNAQNAIQVVEHRAIRNTADPIRSAELKGFMSTKPPQLKDKGEPPAPKRKKPSEDDEDEKERMNLKKDVELQQLLRESHLLDRSQGSALNPTGKNRHKALDMRLQALGSKQSVYKIEKMPMSHRKGMVSKTKEREDTRRRQAKENGIVLERPELKKKLSGKRERGVGGPGIGKMRGATLRLSKNDIRGIVGSKSSRGKGRKR